MRNRLTLKVLLVLTAVWVGSSLAWVEAGEGQGTAAPGAHLRQLNPGTFVYGAPLDRDAVTGKVVVVNIGGG